LIRLIVAISGPLMAAVKVTLRGNHENRKYEKDTIDPDDR